MNIATIDKLVLRVRDGVLFGGYQDDTGPRVTLADGWYWATLTGDDTTMWGPFGMSSDASEAAWSASISGVEVHVYYDRGDSEFGGFDSLPPEQVGVYLIGEVSKE